MLRLIQINEVNTYIHTCSYNDNRGTNTYYYTSTLNCG